MNKIEQKLQDLKISIPSASSPATNYVSFVQSGNLVFIAGQTSIGADGNMVTGRLGEDLDLETGRAAARLCGLRLIAQIRAACGGDR